MKSRRLDLVMQLYRGLRRLVRMPRDIIPSEEPIQPADTAARKRLETELKRALWAQQASKSWAALSATKALQPNL